MASDIVDKLCQSVAAKLDGKVIGTFSGEHLIECHIAQVMGQEENLVNQLLFAIITDQ